jgi:hypothetical protein
VTPQVREPRSASSRDGYRWPAAHDVKGPLRRTVIASVIALIVLLSSAGRSSAAMPKFNPPKSYYLALGDSVSFGYQASKAVPGFTAEGFDTGYVDAFADDLRRIQPTIEVVNYGCPGESSTTFIRGGCPVIGTGFRSTSPSLDRRWMQRSRSFGPIRAR